MSRYNATIALAPGWRMTGRSPCTPEGSAAVSTPKSTTPNLRTGRRFEAIAIKNVRAARVTQAPIAAGARTGDYRSDRYEPAANPNFFRLRLDALLHRVANRHPARGRAPLRGAVEGRAGCDARLSRQTGPRAGRARAAESAVRRGGDGCSRRAAVQLDRFDTRAARIGSRARCGRLHGLSRCGLS